MKTDDADEAVASLGTHLLETYDAIEPCEMRCCWMRRRTRNGPTGLL